VQCVFGSMHIQRDLGADDAEGDQVTKRQWKYDGYDGVGDMRDRKRKSEKEE
jgi:hypothetical protein